MKKYLLCTILLCCLLLSSIVKSQSYSLATIPFEWEGNTLVHPFTGGLNAPQVNELDIDLDGFEDILIFDREGTILLPFIYSIFDETYIYDASFKSIFPPLVNFVKAVDYNQDGIKDLIGQTLEINGGLVVYEGKVGGNGMQFEQIMIGDGTEDFNVVYSNYFSNRFPLSIPITDIPVIKDLDGDGDIDVVTFDGLGSHLELHINMDVESGNSPNTFDMKLVDNCYGGLLESGLSASLNFSPAPGDCARTGDEETRHAGSTLLSLDLGNDGDEDLLIGDLSSTLVAAAFNEKSDDLDWFIDADFSFPSYDQSIDMDLFIGNFLVDVDKDGKQDLIAAPNSLLSGVSVNNVHYYKNIGDNEFVFEKVEEDFIVKGTIDLGTFSSPEFVDVDQDGLTDLMVSTKGVREGSTHIARLVYFRNVGTDSSPSFALEDEDYLGFSMFSETGIQPAIAFGDLDGDEDLDLIVGFNNGRMFYYQNTAGPLVPFSFAPPIYPFMDLQPGSNIKPEIYDLNNDGLGDLIIGEQNGSDFEGTLGSFNYYENVGSVGNPEFVPNAFEAPNTAVLGEAVIINGTKSSSAPIIVTVNDELQLISGSEFGNIFQWRIDAQDPFAPYTLLTEDLGEINEGRRTDLDLADIDGDGLFEMVVGNPRGGIAIYDTDLIADKFVANADVKGHEILVFPNPVKDILYMDQEYSCIDVNIFDMKGQQMMTVAFEETGLDVSRLHEGMYFIEWICDGKRQVSKFVKH